MSQPKPSIDAHYSLPNAKTETQIGKKKLILCSFISCLGASNGTAVVCVVYLGLLYQPLTASMGEFVRGSITQLNATEHFSKEMMNTICEAAIQLPTRRQKRNSIYWCRFFFKIFHFFCPGIGVRIFTLYSAFFNGPPSKWLSIQKLI